MVHYIRGHQIEFQRCMPVLDYGFVLANIAGTDEILHILPKRQYTGFPLLKDPVCET